MFPILDPIEVTERLENLIAKHTAKKISVAEIKRRIYESDGDPLEASNRFQKWWYNTIPKRRMHSLDMQQMNELLQAFADAWNVFPHHSLGDKSPQQMVQEETEKHPDITKKSRNDPMPDVTVGDVTMPWDDYRKMLKRMKKLQKPFKQWMEELALPAYKKYLATRFKAKKTIEKHYDVADHFLQRALFVGFLNFENIRPAFAVWEFPAWWPDHVLYNDLNDDQVWSSLCDFLWFAEMILHRSIPGVWEEAEGEDHEGCDDVTCPYCGGNNTEPVADGLCPGRTKAGRNDPCSCGSGKKYKKCCGAG